MQRDKDNVCSDCDDLSRRGFLRTVGSVALGGALLPLASGRAAPKPTSAAETAVRMLYETLSADQKKVVCFPFDHELRKRISANWKITPKTIGDPFYTKAQRELIDKVVRGVTSEDGYGRLKQQMKEDYGGFENYAVAIFGEPGSGKFELELTGRHLTLRADGDSVENAAFGGPLVYGHGKGNPDANLFHYQTRKVNEVFAALEGKQREQALLADAPGESKVPLQGKEGKFPGVAVSDLKKDQQGLVADTLKVLLDVYRQEDVAEVMDMIKQGGGLEQLHLAFYSEGDLKNDKVWDIWRVEGPTFVWHFRGAPHVHAYINIGIKG